MLSEIILFTSFPSHPHWYMHMIPYLAVMSVYIDSRKFLLFETIAIAAMIFANYCMYYYCYTPNNAINMLLHRLTGSPDLIDIEAIVKGQPYAVTNKAINFIVNVFKASSIFNSIYFVCIWTCAWLALPHKVSNFIEDGYISRSYVMLRLLFNALVCSCPFILYFLAIIRS